MLFKYFVLGTGFDPRREEADQFLSGGRSYKVVAENTAVKSCTFAMVTSSVPHIPCQVLTLNNEMPCNDSSLKQALSSNSVYAATSQGLCAPAISSSLFSPFLSVIPK